MTGRVALCLVTLRHPRVARVQRRTLDLNGQFSAPTVTKRPDTPLNRPGAPRRVRSRTTVRQRASDRTHRCPTVTQHPVGSRDGPERVFVDRKHHSVRSTSRATLLHWVLMSHRPDAPVHALSLHAGRTNRTQPKHPRSARPPRPVSRKIAFSLPEKRRIPNPSLPLKLHLLRKCANTTKCTSSCACVLTFL
jgi:hypothetical protein